MKRIAFISIMIASLLLSGCSNDEKTTSIHQHDFEIQTINSTCEDKGYTNHKCKECGFEYQDNYVDALGHDYSIYVESEGTLEADEGKEIYKCSRCDKQQVNDVSSLNAEDKGVDYIALKNSRISCLYREDEDSVSLLISDYANIVSGEIYYTFNADYGLFYHKSYKLTFQQYEQPFVYGYENNEYPYLMSNVVRAEIDTSNDAMRLTFPYSNYGLTKEHAIGNFAFYPLIQYEDKTYQYDLLNPYVVKTYSETWLKVNSKNRLYYPTKYQTHHLDNWSRPDITKAETNWTYALRAETPEESIVGGLIAQEKGATNIDFNLLYLKEIYRNKKDFEKIFHHFRDIGSIAVYYNSAVTQEERRETLKLAVEAGCGGLDLQGFMFHNGDTKATHTKENIAYWENLGYDMSFVYAGPKETVIDPNEDAQIMEFIEEIHGMGAKVLQSCHVGTDFTRQQAVAYGEFLNHRNLDIIKVVSTASNSVALEETILANKDAYYDDRITAKFSIHTSGSSQSDISRVIAPLFYHCYMAFHYTYLCKLQMIMDIKNSGITFEDSITVKEAIDLVKGKSNDPELEYLINENLMLTNNFNYAYGASSNLSNRWSISENTSTLTMRTSEGTNTFSIRGLSSKSLYRSNSFTFETSLSGSFKPYTSSKRLPKFGIYLGNQNKLLALTYNYKTDSNGDGINFSIGLRSNSYSFGYDNQQAADAIDNKIIDDIDVSSNIVNGDNLRLKIVYTLGDLLIYYSQSSSGNYTLAGEFSYQQIKQYFTHDNDKNVYFGNVAEAYMGSKSAGIDNIISFSNSIS